MDMPALEFLLLSVWVISVFLLLNRKNIKLLRKLAPHFNGSLAFYSMFIPALDGIYEGLKFNVHVTPKFLEVRGTLKIRLNARSLVGLRVFRRSFVGRAVGKIGCFSPVTTGQPSFDAGFVVLARQVEIARSYLQNADRRQAVQQVFNYGFSMLVIDERGSWIEKQDYDRMLDLEPNRVSAVLHFLKTLSVGI
jgi:hypothetical protein